MSNDTWEIGGKSLNSRLFVGSALYPNPEVMADSIKASGAEVITVSLRRQNPTKKGGQRFWELVQSFGTNILPNTAGCKTVKDAVTTAHMAREMFDTTWIKLEVIGDDYTLQPDTRQTVEAARILCEEDFEVFPYTTEDLVIAEALVEAGCKVIMPWAAPIGSGQGILNTFALKTLRARLPNISLVVDAGIGKPSDACVAMELGYDGCLVNSAIALSKHAEIMGAAFRDAVQAGRQGYLAGKMMSRDIAQPSTPTLGTPFWHVDGGPKEN